MTSSQYKADSERAIEEVTLYMTCCCSLKGDGKDAWIFNIDDTLISTIPYFKKHVSGREKCDFIFIGRMDEREQDTHSRSHLSKIKGSVIPLLSIFGNPRPRRTSSQRRVPLETSSPHYTLTFPLEDSPKRLTCSGVRKPSRATSLAAGPLKLLISAQSSSPYAPCTAKLERPCTSVTITLSQRAKTKQLSNMTGLASSQAELPPTSLPTTIVMECFNTSVLTQLFIRKY